MHSHYSKQVFGDRAQRASTAAKSARFRSGPGASRGSYRGGSSASSSYSSSSHSSTVSRAHSGYRGTASRSSGGYQGSRPHTSRFGSRPAGRFGGSRGGGNRGGGQHIDVSRFINKTVVTEVAEHFTPEHAFADFKIHDSIKANIIAKGYVTPTPIQDSAIPQVLEGRDVVGIANTGTGKTAAFLVPLLHKVILNPKEQILVVVPTRELALQIQEELKGFVQKLRIFSVTCVGGMPIGRQISDLRYFNNFIIGTPGRIKDLMERRFINLSTFKTAVLDEADRMLDMGFIEDMKFMMGKMPADRQTLFFSATMSREIEALIKNFLKDPVMISVKTRDTSKSVDQDVVTVPPGKNKMDVLHEMLNNPEFAKVLIFGKTKHGVERLSRELTARGFKADSIHGDKNQARRKRALDTFKNNHVQVLVATDVAARGLDISGVTHVINFDLPATYEDYVHRIGRTGRGGKTGKALTFIA